MKKTRIEKAKERKLERESEFSSFQSSTMPENPQPRRPTSDSSKQKMPRDVAAAAAAAAAPKTKRKTKTKNKGGDEEDGSEEEKATTVTKKKKGMPPLSSLLACSDAVFEGRFDMSPGSLEALKADRRVREAIERAESAAVEKEEKV